MVFTVNQVPLDNPAGGWELSRGTVPLMSLSIEATVSRQAGRDGVTVDGVTHSQGQMEFTIRCERDTARAGLFALFRTPVLEVRDTERPGWVATGRLSSSSMEEHYDFLDFDEEMFVVEIPGGCWRGDEVTTTLTAAAPSGANLSLFSGLSAPVQDALVRFKGPLEDPQVFDTSGAFVVLDGALTSGQFLRFDANTGRAWLTGTDTWTGGAWLASSRAHGGRLG